MPARMVVTDLDGTLLGADGRVSALAAATLGELRALGVPVVFATARPLRMTRGVLDAAAPDYVLANNGATVCRGEAVLRETPIDSAAASGLIAALRQHPAVSCVSVELGDVIHSNYRGDPPPGWNIVYSDLTAPLPARTPKISVECADARVLDAVLRGFPGLRRYGNQGEAWHQIMDRSATKADALAWLAGRLGIALQDIAAFGDDENDASMLALAGYGVAVANAVDACRKAARYVCGANAEDGVARWLRAHFSLDE